MNEWLSNVLDQKTLEVFAGDLHVLLSSARLQKVDWCRDDLLILEFYGRTEWTLLFALDHLSPQVLLFDGHRKWGKSKAKPLTLFLRSHAVGKKLSELSVRREFGRVLELRFAGGEELVMEVRLIPHQPNVLVKTVGKQISLFKPQDLKIQNHQELETKSAPENELQTNILDWSMNWAESHLQTSRSQNSKQAEKQLALTQEKQEKQLQAALEKRAQLLSKLSSEEEKLQAGIDQLAQIGNQLKSSEKLTSEQIDFLQSAKLNGASISTLFDERKKRLHRLTGLRVRITQLQKEDSIEPPRAVRAKQEESGKDFEKEIFRKIKLEQWQVRRGKNADQNLQLLRQSQSWHWWVHLRDEPGAYAILAGNKNEKPTKEVLAKAALWLIRETVKRSWVGEQKFSVVAAECKFVRPVKGANKGLVTYTEATHFTVASKSAR